MCHIPLNSSFPGENVRSTWCISPGARATVLTSYLFFVLSGFLIYSFCKCLSIEGTGSQENLGVTKWRPQTFLP